MSDDTDVVVQDAPSHTSMDNLLSDAPIVRDQPRDDAGKFAAPPVEPAKPAVEAPAAPAAPVEPAKAAAPAVQPFTTDREAAFYKGMQEEKRKRQELEARLAALPKEPEKQFWDDPEGKINELRQEVHSAVTNTRLNTAEAIARQKYPDFDEKVGVFAQILQENPGLQSTWLSAADPAEFAYRLSKNRMELHAAGSLDQMRARIEAETRAKIEAEVRAKVEAEQKTRESLPPSLSDVRGTGGTGKPVWGGPTSMENILFSK